MWGRVLAQHPAYLSARVTLGRSLVELGRLDEARAEFLRVLDAAPDKLIAVGKLAEIHQRTQQLVYRRTADDLFGRRLRQGRVNGR